MLFQFSFNRILSQLDGVKYIQLVFSPEVRNICEEIFTPFEAQSHKTNLPETIAFEKTLGALAFFQSFLLFHLALIGVLRSDFTRIMLVPTEATDFRTDLIPIRLDNISLTLILDQYLDGSHKKPGWIP